MTGYYDFFVLCGIVNIQSMLNWGPRQVVHIVLYVQCYQSTSENAGDSLKSVCVCCCASTFQGEHPGLQMYSLEECSLSVAITLPVGEK